MVSKKSGKKAALQAGEPTPGIAKPTEQAPPSAFPIVGIGASAGGLAAFEAFFSGMPTDVDPGMAFVLVQHLAPDHKSILADLIRRYTRMPVFEVEDGMVVQVNSVYIIPPNYDMALLNGSLQLLEPSVPRGQRLPIDFFFRSLAQDQHERAIGIVLSGTGSDGTVGVRAIKAEGGMVMAQNPESTEFDGMPRSAIATGQVDFTLPAVGMPARLIAYAAKAIGQRPRLMTTQTPRTEGALKKIFILLRAQTGHDFSQYKPSTIHRRIERRMAVHVIEEIDTYVKYMQQTPAEVEALFRDLLIGVTNFFRDPEAFQLLEELIIPRIFADKPAGAEVRVWSTGCSTGEEAYSLAILLQERMEALKKSYSVQVFATDINSQAIATARAGLYPASIAADISPERLARFFTLEADGSAYRINKLIRDLLIFSEQDVVKDPPFSRLDLISCRNLLIYFGADLQKKIIPLFHYALNPGGTLFLGTSEGIGEFDDLFAVLDRKAKLYQRNANSSGVQGVAFSQFIAPVTVATAHPRRTGNPGVGKLPLRELTEQAVLRQLAPVAALVNGQGDVLYLHGRTGMYLEPAPGETRISNILKMAREGLRHELGIALHQVGQSQEVVRCPGLSVKTNGHFKAVNLTLSPVRAFSGEALESPLYLVLLENAPCSGSEHAAQPSVDERIESSAEARITALRQELRAKEGYLQSANEELESSGEELKSANEEMQSVNEELQSTNEELETSKEELQSVNEELFTVNAELQTNVADLSHANNDMNNLLAGTGIATVFVDHQLRILRFTPTASAIINLIPSDVGRPVGHVVVNLVSYSQLTADIKAVLATLIAREIDVEATDGRWYSLRIQPYRTLDNVIEGAVITFVDITEMVQVRESLRRLAAVVNDAHDAITVQDLDGRTLAWNPGALRLYGWTEAEALGMNVHDRVPPEQRAGALAKLVQLGQAEILQPYRTQRISRDGALIDVSIISTALLNEAGQMYAVATTERAFGGEGR